MNYSNIAVCSYNLNWEIMDHVNSKNAKFINEYSLKEITLFKKNIISNIQNIKNYYNPQIYCFQEASNFDDFLYIFKDTKFNKYDKYVNSSGPEFMVTIWDKSRFDLINVQSGEFQEGRPFCLFLLKDLVNNNYIILINVHAGHIPNTLSSIFTPIQKQLDKLDKFDKFDKLPNLPNIKISRVIMAGDFNRDINYQVHIDNKLFLMIGEIKYNFKYYDKPMGNTCCSISSPIYKRNFDFVLDSLEPVLIRHEIIKEPWYSFPASDHVMIMSILKN
jgi:hypothetical protein